MKIAPPSLSPLYLAGDGASPLPGGDPFAPNDGFAELLASMLENDRTSSPSAGRGTAGPRWAALSSPDCHERSITPDGSSQIGSSSMAFERGQLLVETACDLTHAEPSIAIAQLSVDPSEARHASIAAWNEVPPLPWQQFADARSISFATNWIVGQALPFAPQASMARADAFSRAVPIKNTAVPQMPSVGWSSAAPPGPSEPAISIEPTVEPGPNFGAELAGNTAHLNEPFSARLITSDGTVRLLLRLPRLDEGERNQIETGLARLLSSFGHRRHDIVIHEIGRA